MEAMPSWIIDILPGTIILCRNTARNNDFMQKSCTTPQHGLLKYCQEHTCSFADITTPHEYVMLIMPIGWDLWTLL